ncbi:MAG: prolyl oligopeptidase family serine peptidase [Acidobacteria bacterium]|nr:prolyl oligopeptidase family serine peptidase [Acidobacteriota bacterium]
MAKVKTPTILLVGEEDPRGPLPQSVEMYRALRSYGVPTHLYVVPQEGQVDGAAAPAVQAARGDGVVRAAGALAHGQVGANPGRGEGGRGTAQQLVERQQVAARVNGRPNI